MKPLDVASRFGVTLMPALDPAVANLLERGRKAGKPRFEALTPEPARGGALPPVLCQALLYPVTDLTASSASYQRVTSDVPLTAATMHYFIEHYTPQAGSRSD